MPPTKAQLTAIHAIIAKMPNADKALKESFIRMYSKGRTTSSKDLTLDEATLLIRSLKDQERQTPRGKAEEKMRRKIISMAHDIGWKLEDGRADMRHLDDWCVKFGQFKKKINQHNYDELVSLVTQFEMGPYLSFLKRF